MQPLESWESAEVGVGRDHRAAMFHCDRCVLSIWPRMIRWQDIYWGRLIALTSHIEALPMPSSLFDSVTPAQLRALRRLRQDASLTPAERDRVEVILRSHQGETLRELAADLGYRYDTALAELLQVPDRTWTSAQLAQGLADVHDIQLSARQCRKYLQAMGATWRRTQASLQYRQDPQQVARARTDLQALKKSPGRGPSNSFAWTKSALP